MKQTPKEVAVEEVNKRIVTKDQAKEKYLKWIDTNLNSGYSSDVIDFWNDVKNEINKL